MIAHLPHRRRLPNRRSSETRTLTVGNHTFAATAGFNPADGLPSELFLDGAKSGAELAGVAGSRNTVPTSIVGAALDLLCELEADG